MIKEIVPAGAGHAPVLAALHASSFAAPWRIGEFETLLHQPGVAAWITTHQETPVGFILVRAVADEAEILTLAVLPAERRQGIGAALLHAAATHLRGGGTARLFLEVAADNAAALALYERNGFAATGRRAGYYAREGKQVDAMTMTRLLA